MRTRYVSTLAQHALLTDSFQKRLKDLGQEVSEDEDGDEDEEGEE